MIVGMWGELRQGEDSITLNTLRTSGSLLVFMLLSLYAIKHLELHVSYV